MNNTNANALSRSTQLPEATAEERQEQEVSNIQAEFSKETLIQAQRDDPDLQSVARWVRERRIPSKEEVRGRGEELNRWREIAGAVRINEQGLLTLP